MKTQEQKLQHVMEAAGECWHESEFQPITYLDGQCSELMLVCRDCHEVNVSPNPSPDDLNELFRLAAKLGYYTFGADVRLTDFMFSICSDEKIVERRGDTFATAMLDALFIATGGTNEVQ